MERIDILAALSQVSRLRYEHIAHIDLSNGEDYSTTAAWEQEHGVAPSLATTLAKAVAKYDPIRFNAELSAAQCRVIGIGDSEYPSQLLELYRPPLILYIQGSIGALNAISVVGSRKPTPYGRQVVEAFVPPLVASGITIVSGLAQGVDTLAHVVTLRCEGTTLAVLGSGLDCIYPHANRHLATRIVEAGGAIISEYSPKTPPLRHHFPARNRIISGLSRGVIVVEGDIRSGSLITAEHAMEQGRDVFAVPGNIFSPQSRGPNRLIVQGAIPLLSPSNLLEYYGLVTGEEPETQLFSTEEQLILTALGHEPRDVDEIIQRAGLPVTLVAAKLVELEVAGAVQRQPGGLYIQLRIG
ncbi:MAG: DNA-processing protein DprA [Bacillota bacterium]|nr:DNA-processing protein DprA [Bacillota bacterium]